ncbi:MAG TPA: hypothetical protein VHX62_11070 [Solirubrobacteraceae bacterium]|jgi:uncharacterized membrane protein|nr:hypothetical protein [Solirubrobacteraceae bacterium]
MRPVVAAAVLGAGGGLRSFLTPAVRAAPGGGPFAGGGRFIAFGAAIGELIADKQPDMGSRWSPRGLAFRLAFCTGAGRDLAGWTGAVAADAAALSAARAGSLLRGRIAGRPGALPAAMLEDVLSYALVTLATRAPE